MNRFGILIIIMTLMFWGIKCNAQSQFSDTLTRMEKSILGVDYSSQNDEQRIKRLEEAVYGLASNNSIQQRFNKLSKDLSADTIGKEIKPKTDTFEENEEIEKNPKADSSVNYPIIDNLEQMVFNNTYKNTEIQQRLANLEKNVLKKNYNDDLNSRVERLKTALKPKYPTQSNSEYDNYNELYPSDNLNKYLSKNNDDTNNPGIPSGFGANIPSYNKNNSVLDEYNDTADLDISITSLEKKILRKTYPNDTMSNRLLRMEVKTFNSTFTDDDEQTRYDRIASAYEAKKTSRKYDNNKFSQHAATAMQIGAFLLMILAMVL